MYFVGVYCIISVSYSRECSWRTHLRWCVILVANKRPSDLSSANHCQGQLRSPQSVTVGTQAPFPLLFLRRMPVCVSPCVTDYELWLGLIAYAVSRYSEWLRSGFGADFLLSNFNFLYHFPSPHPLFFFLCAFCPFFLVWFSLTSFCVGPLISSLVFLLHFVLCCYPRRMIFLFIIPAIISAVH